MGRQLRTTWGRLQTSVCTLCCLCSGWLHYCVAGRPAGWLEVKDLYRCKQARSVSNHTSSTGRIEGLGRSFKPNNLCFKRPSTRHLADNQTGQAQVGNLGLMAVQAEQCPHLALPAQRLAAALVVWSLL